MNSERKASWLIPITMLLIALTGVLMLDKRHRQAPEASIDHPGNADYYALNARVTTTNERGVAAYEMTADQVLYFPDGTSGLKEVHAYSLGGADSIWDVKADNGRVSSEGDKVELSGNVKLAGAVADEPVVVVSNRMTVYPDSEQMETADPVVITGETHVTTATGMRGEFKARRLELLSNVETTYTPGP